MNFTKHLSLIRSQEDLKKAAGFTRLANNGEQEKSLAMPRYDSMMGIEGISKVENMFSITKVVQAPLLETRPSIHINRKKSVEARNKRIRSIPLPPIKQRRYIDNEVIHF
jgi:hypothetical protein